VDRHVIPDQTRLDVPSLTGASVAQLLGDQALPPATVELIERLAQGYPRLAVELGRALRNTPAATSTAHLLSTGGVHNVLSEMLPDENLRQTLAVLALFERVGFDGALAADVDVISQQFNLDRLQVRAHIRQETGRFISTAGRCRRVTPLALAVWLVRELIGKQPSAIADSIVRLPENLSSAFRGQLEVLGGDPTVEDVLEEVARLQASRFRGPDGQITELGASFLHSLAFAVPELAARIIEEQLAGADRDLLYSQPSNVRRNLVWALSHLLWFQSTFETAATTLLRLAEAESETYGNNATNEVAGAFQLQLGGTEVPYNSRLAWWDQQLASATSAKKRVLLSCLAKGLDDHEMRMSNWRGARLQTKEWGPATIGELIEIKRALWDRVIDMTRSDEAELREAALEIIERHVRSLAAFDSRRRF
jgi:hypothetical protein